MSIDGIKIATLVDRGASAVSHFFDMEGVRPPDMLVGVNERIQSHHTCSRRCFDFAKLRPVRLVGSCQGGNRADGKQDQGENRHRAVRMFHAIWHGSFPLIVCC